jgi:hypothetical protein
MEAGTTPPPEEAAEGYTGSAVAGAVLATLFFPFISLIAALLLQGGQTDLASGRRCARGHGLPVA